MPDKDDGLLTRRLLLAGGATALALAVGGAAIATLNRGVYALPTESDEIIRQAAIDGVTMNLLVPDLRGAKVVVPDRPHDPRDAMNPAARAQMTRRRVFEVDTNSFGLRGRRSADEIGRPRCVLLGDSVAFGWGLSFRDSPGERLADALGVPVVNAGVPAMRPDQLSVWGRHVLKAVPADLVVLLIRPRRDEVAGMQQLVARLREVTDAPIVLILSPLSTFDVRGAASLADLKTTMAAALPGVPVMEGTDVLRANLPADGVVLQREHGVQRMVDARDGTVLLEVPDQPDRPAPEIYEAFEQDPDLAEPFMFDGGHADAEGSELLAEAIAGFLRSEGVAPGR